MPDHLASRIAAAAVVAAMCALPTSAADAQIKLPGRTAPDPGAPVTYGPPMAPDTVLGEAAGARITRGDYDLELTRLPPDLRGGFSVSEKRVLDLLTRMLVTRRLAAEADAERLLDDPAQQVRLAAEIERYKAQLALQRYEARAAAQFDAELPKWEARARDIYQVEAKQFDTPEARTAARLSIAKARYGGTDGALAKMRELRARWLGGEDYAKLARETDDKGSAGRDGTGARRVERDDLPAAVANAVFALKDGEATEPLEVGENVVVWRVLAHVAPGRRSFAEVRGVIMADLRRQYVDSERDRVLGEANEAARAGIRAEEVERMVPKIDAEEIERLRRQATEKSRRQQRQ